MRDYIRNFANSTSPHNVFFGSEKNGKLWGDAESFEAILVDFLDILESKNRFLAFFVHKMERKRIMKEK